MLNFKRPPMVSVQIMNLLMEDSALYIMDTPGYVDQEYHQYYQLTSRNVFSFGVVLVERISSMPAVDITRHLHEINLSNRAINKIQGDALHELVDHSLGFESDSLLRRLMTAVAQLAFQCLQNDKDLRPSMEQVLQNLQEIRRLGNDDPEKGIKTMQDVPADDAVLLNT
ncbi:LEAF RUST 10 DISEASE-RESISTANCE LOCUS RECEPTOR-LIKE PROTEIN KINASE-like 1.3 [Linum grandiflorum]